MDNYSKLKFLSVKLAAAKQP